ncbi:MAG: phosphoenolpyruvate--protein phosphotransferase [Planctomycetes bacterium]|nr:phosphoenolpyruvate--protein phosphotransferase [Planctomycetota bacterium]
MNTNVTLVAPLSGMFMRIEEVPDPVFAEKMLGDGIAIDPMEETLRAPCAGTVTQMPKSAHAVTITSDNGVEILMHIGLETVLLDGKGFTALVKEGDTVAAGDPLIDFDADYLAHNAASLVTMVVITTGSVAAKPVEGGYVAQGKDIVLEARSEDDEAGDGGAAAAPGPAAATVESDPIDIVNPAGLHARPAAVLANSAKQFSADVRLVKRGKSVNARSIVSIMGLEVEKGDTVTLTASGADAEAAVATLSALIASGLGEDLAGEESEAAAPITERIQAASMDPNVVNGVAASPGVVAGAVFQLRHEEIVVEEKGRGSEVEQAALLAALEKSGRELVELQNELRTRTYGPKAAIFAAHRELLEDPELLESAVKNIAAGDSAAFAWKKAYTQQADMLAGLGNELLAGRANDIRDVGRRVLGHLSGTAVATPDIPANVIFIAENLTPSDTAGLDKTKVLGFATTSGSATSHVAILARSLGIPAVAAVEERALAIANNTTVILDGEQGRIRLNPSPEQLAFAEEAQAALSLRRKSDLADSHKPATTEDGHTVKVVANIGGLAEAEEVAENDGEGVGLLRSEFLFLQRADAPTSDEQAAVYTAIAKTVGPDRDLVVRTLDVGGDKPLAYLPLPKEENPFLGIRGIRLEMVDKTLLTSQIRAILAAAPFTRLHIMFPMVSTIQEFRAAKAIVLREKEAAGIEADIRIGIMVEVPSTAMLAENIAREVDFFSIGTNDLTQYALAVDRGNPRLAAMADSLHPAVLALIARTVEGAHKHGKWVGVCGGLASEVAAVPVLLGLGVDEFSVSVPVVPTIKAAIRRQRLTACRELAAELLGLLTAEEVRERLKNFQ